MKTQTIQICPICDQVVGSGTPVSWDLVINGRPAQFRISTCAVDAALCEIFPTLRRALINSPMAVELLGNLMRGQA